MLPLDGLLVVAIEQAVAAPACTLRLADAGARVIKIERAEGETARHYDQSVHGTSAYFAWLNRGKESAVLDIKDDADRALVERMVARADVFVQNLAPGAARRLGRVDRGRHDRDECACRRAGGVDRTLDHRQWEGRRNRHVRQHGRHDERATSPS
jgi:hypothetical protein